MTPRQAARNSQSVRPIGAAFISFTGEGASSHARIHGHANDPWRNFDPARFERFLRKEARRAERRLLRWRALEPSDRQLLDAPVEC